MGFFSFIFNSLDYIQFVIIKYLLSSLQALSGRTVCRIKKPTACKGIIPLGIPSTVGPWQRVRVLFVVVCGMS